jgi:hypothetical protein
MKYILMACLTVGLVACSSTAPSVSLENGPDSTTARLGVDQLGRTPLPVGSKMRGPESLIFGVGDNWMGRAVVELHTDASASYNFFADQFPRQGWTLVAAVRGKKNLLVFTRGDRSATVELDEGGLLSNVVAHITISPTGSPAASPPGVAVQPLGSTGARRP